MSDETSDGTGAGGFDVGVECPACGAAFSVSRIRRGSAEPCPVCRCRVSIPGRGGPAEQEPTAAVLPVSPPPVVAEPGAATHLAPAVRWSDRCFVCLQDDVRVNPLNIAPVISELTGHRPLEVKMQVVGGMGVLAQGVAGETARAVLDRLGGLQVQAFAVAERRVPTLARELPIVRVLGAEERQLRIQTDATGASHPVPWAMLAAGFCTKRHVVRGGPPELEVETRLSPVFLTGSGPMVTSRRVYRTARREPEPDMECTLLLRGKTGSLYSLRFTEKHVRYTYLGTKITPSSARNFSIFLSDVIRHCPRAFFPRSTRTVAAGNRLRAARMKRDGDYERYLKWVLCCVAHRSQGRAES